MKGVVMKKLDGALLVIDKMPYTVRAGEALQAASHLGVGDIITYEILENYVIDIRPVTAAPPPRPTPQPRALPVKTSSTKPAASREGTGAPETKEAPIPVNSSEIPNSSKSNYPEIPDGSRISGDEDLLTDAAGLSPEARLHLCRSYQANLKIAADAWALSDHPKLSYFETLDAINAGAARLTRRVDAATNRYLETP